MSTYTLYAYFRSSCSARVRIALNYKSISYETVPVNLVKNEQLSKSHMALNPSASVPLLVCKEPDGGAFKIGQSVAILEYLEEMHPEHPLLPPASDPRARAIVRTLVNIISADTQPVTNLRVMRRVKELGADAQQWNRDFMDAGIKAYEEVVQDWAGKYSFGDVLTVADACLMPAVWNAERYGVDMDQYPVVLGIVKNLMELPAVKEAHYFRQSDTPDELRLPQ